MEDDSLVRLGLSAVLFGAATAAFLWLAAELRDPTGDVRLWLAYRWDDVKDHLRGVES